MMIENVSGTLMHG